MPAEQFCMDWPELATTSSGDKAADPLGDCDTQPKLEAIEAIGGEAIPCGDSAEFGDINLPKPASNEKNDNNKNLLN